MSTTKFFLSNLVRNVPFVTSLEVSLFSFAPGMLDLGKSQA